MTPQERLETYAREQMKKTGKFSEKDIDEVIKTILSSKLLSSEESVNAFIKASQ